MERRVRWRQSATELNICFVTETFYIWPQPLLLSNVMPDQPPGANTMSAAITDVKSSEQNGIPVNRVTSQAGSSLNQRAPSDNEELIHDTGKISKLYILARAVPSYARNGQEISFRPLQHNIWCLVFDASTEKMKFMLLCACQDLARSGVDIEDVDWGKGIHPVADKTWMAQLISEGKWQGYKAKYVASYSVGKRSYNTVLLHDMKPEHGELLGNLRGVLGYNSDALVRVPCSKITRVKEKKWISQLIKENFEDPARCKHSRGAKSVRKASKLKSKN
jgi:hypothetical protein